MNLTVIIFKINKRSIRKFKKICFKSLIEVQIDLNHNHALNWRDLFFKKLCAIPGTNPSKLTIKKQNKIS